MSLNHTGRIIAISVGITLAITASIFYSAFYGPLKARELRLTDCIEKLEDVINAESPNYRYGTGDYRYDPETDRCLYRSNFVADTPTGRYLEKFIVDASTGETLAKYAELNGKPVEGDLTEFSAAVDRLFPTEEQ